MKCAKLLFFFTLLILVINNNIYSNQTNTLNTGQNNNDQIFILLAINKNDEYHFAKYDLNKLKKCKFPEGPWRNNSIIVSDFSKINIESWKKIESDCIILPMFCIEAPKSHEPHEPSVYKNCGFELPGNQKLGYVFNLDRHIKEVKGAIISNETFNLILDENKKQSETVAVPEQEETSQVPADELDELADFTENLDETKVDHSNFRPTSKIEIFITRICVYLLMKSLDIRSYITDSYIKFKNLFNCQAKKNESNT